MAQVVKEPFCSVFVKSLVSSNSEVGTSPWSYGYGRKVVRGVGRPTRSGESFYLFIRLFRSASYLFLLALRSWGQSSAIACFIHNSMVGEQSEVNQFRHVTSGMFDPPSQVVVLVVHIVEKVACLLYESKDK